MAFGDLPLDAPCKPNKGHEGGACNRQSCQAEPALHWNHGSHSWYCADCARDIGEDVVNKRDWELRWLPECGHGMFETREEMDAREAEKSAAEPELGPSWLWEERPTETIICLGEPPVPEFTYQPFRKPPTNIHIPNNGTTYIVPPEKIGKRARRRLRARLPSPGAGAERRGW